MRSELFGAGGEGGCKHRYKTRMERSPHIPHPCVLRRPWHHWGGSWLGCPCCPQAPALDGGQQGPLVPCHHPRPCPHPCWDRRGGMRAGPRVPPCARSAEQGRHRVGTALLGAGGASYGPSPPVPAPSAPKASWRSPRRVLVLELSPLWLWCGAHCGHLPIAPDLMVPGHDQGSPGAMLSPRMPKLG